MELRALVRRWSADSPTGALLAVAAAAVSLWVVIGPLTASRYPPMTDLPFHAAFGGTFLHYWDPSYHLQEQFRLAPFTHPYTSMYVLIAVLMTILPMLWAVRIALVILLLLVPAGLAVLFHGAGKSPLLGLLGLGLCWGNLTHWGFISYVASLGLLAMSIGLSLMVVDRSTPLRQLALFLALVAVFFTHPFRSPFAIAAALGTGVVMYPATRRGAGLILPILGALAILLVWWKFHPAALSGKVELGLHLERWPREFGAALTDGFKDDGLRNAMFVEFAIAWYVALAAGIHAVARYRRGLRRFTAWDAGVTLVPLACAGVFFAMFLSMPMTIGSWFYVYPREATATVVVLLGACPDLPRVAWLRVPLVAAMCAGGLIVSHQVRLHYADFATDSEDFYAITRQIGRAPKLYYSIVDHTPTNRSISPYSHMAAYVQAERGGWLSWSFAVWGQPPVVYRRPDEPGVVSLPPPPSWNPKIEAPFYDWMLVRDAASPAAQFSRDPDIHLVDHRGKWWLFHRQP